jgi:hypothetical protein
MEGIDASVWQTIVQVGGAPVALLVAAKMMWGNFAERMDKLERTIDRLHEVIQGLDRRLLTIEIQSQIEP